MKIAVVGGGINGLCSAWALAEQEHSVTLFEKEKIMGQTSAASSKLLHGGLRYLEHFEFRLVKEALTERRWWLDNVKHLTRRLPIIYPIYQNTRPRWKIKIGLLFYDFLAGKKGIGRHRWLTKKQIKRCSPSLKQQGLTGAYLFFDGQMDDKALGLWVADKCSQLNVTIKENSPVTQININGQVTSDGQIQKFDRVINVAGPWSNQLLEQSGLSNNVSLDLVRGSHLIFNQKILYGHMLEVPEESRVFFVLPYQKQTLLGTTEVRQDISQPIICSEEERDYLLAGYNHYFEPIKTPVDIVMEYAGLRPLLHTSESASENSREYHLSWQNNLLTVTGGKWTTARSLGKAVAASVAKRS